MSYTFRTIIEPDEKGTFHGYVPALLGCHTWGGTIEETKRSLKEAISVYIASMIADGEKIPEDKGMESFETITEKEIKARDPISTYSHA